MKSKYLHQRPTLEDGASLDRVLCWPATTPNEYIAYQMMDWGYDYDRIGQYYGTMKREILESLTDFELRDMITEKRRNIEFNEKSQHYKTTATENEVLYHMMQWLNEVYINMLNEPLIKCILTFDRELRQRSNDNKKGQVDLVELKARVPILDVVQLYVNVGRYRPGGLIKCPLPGHEDGSASFMIYHKNNTFNCFGCRGNGSQLDFIMKMEGLSLPDAIKKLSSY